MWEIFAIIFSFNRKWRNIEFNMKGYSPWQWLISHFSSFLAKNFLFIFSGKVIDNFVIDNFSKFMNISFTHSWISVWIFLRMITHSLEGEYKLTWECVKTFEGPHTHTLLRVCKKFWGWVHTLLRVHTHSLEGAYTLSF
jgi:hypothetical protein